MPYRQCTEQSSLKLHKICKIFFKRWIDIRFKFVQILFQRCQEIKECVKSKQRLHDSARLHKKASPKAVSQTHSQMNVLLYRSADQAHSEISHITVKLHRNEDICRSTKHDSNQLCCTGLCVSNCRMRSYFLKQFLPEGRLLFL